jgi:tetratricopeptide (TPR) repeat protein
MSEINIDGSVSGGNVNVGGTQNIHGDLNITTITMGGKRVCPTAPEPPQHFTGRTEELGELRQRLTGDQIMAITAVHSMGGMGKTTMAKALCAMPDSPFSAILWAELGENPNTQALLNDWGRYALEEYTINSDTSLKAVADHVRSHISALVKEICDGQILMVLDDVWDTSIETAELLLSARPKNTSVLITTRDEAVLHKLKAKKVELNELEDEDALGLLKKLRDNRHLTDDHLTRVVTLIKGHPLTLELAIATLNNAEDLADVETILNDYERGIRDGSPFDALDLGVETPDNLNVVFGRSYSRLTEVDQSHFRALGILSPDGVWNRPLASALWQIQDEEGLTKAHKALRLTAFIQQDEVAENKYGGSWYRQHGLLRAYARAILDAGGETEATFGHYADFVIEQSEQFDRLPLEKWIQLDPLLPHVHEIGDGLVQRWYNNLLEATSSMWLKRCSDFAYHVTKYVLQRLQIIQLNGLFKPRGINWLEMGLEVARYQKEHAREGMMLNEIGLLWNWLGEKYKAVEYFEQALLLSQTAGDIGNGAVALNNLGLTWAELGELRQALEFHEQALPLRRKLNDYAGEAMTRNNIGYVLDGMGKKYLALGYYQHALTLSRSISDYAGEAVALNNIGLTWADLGSYHKALEHYNLSLPLSRLIGDQRGEAITLSNMGLAWAELGENHKALEYFDQALPISRIVGDRGGEAKILNNIGKSWNYLGNNQKALDFYKQALNLQQVVKDRSSEGYTLHNMSYVFEASGYLDQAIEYAKKATVLLEEIEDVNVMYIRANLERLISKQVDDRIL